MISKWVRRCVVAVLTIILMVFLGCSAMLDGITPCHIDEEVGVYAEEKMTSYTPFTSLWDAKRLNKKLDQKHKLNQKGLVRLIEDDADVYGNIKDVFTINIQGAQEFQDNVFNPTGPIGAMLVASTGIGIGCLGLSKPGDKKKIVELQNGNNKSVLLGEK